MSTIITEIAYTLSIEPELDGPERNFSEEEDVRYVREQMEWNEWAWCSVKVTAEFRNYKGYDYLGGCSYRSEEDFKHPDGYYPSMCDQARADLISNMEDEIAKQQARFLKNPQRYGLGKLHELLDDYMDLMEEINGTQEA